MPSELVPLSHFAEVNPPSNRPTSLELSSEVSFIAMSDVSEAGDWVSHQTRRIQDIAAGYTAFLEGDVLFAKITPCMENGKGAHARGLVNGAGFGSTEFHILRARSGVDSRFVYHWSSAKLLRLRAENFMSGSAGQQRVGSAFFDHFRVVALPLAEQRRIAEVLDTLDEAIRKTEQLIAKLKQVKQGLLHDLLTRGIDENGELRDPERHPQQFKDSPIGKHPMGWDVVPLSDMADIDRGRFTHRPRNDPAYYGGKYPFIQTGDIAAADGEMLTRYSQSLNSRGAGVSREFPVGTIAITIAANIADTAILGVPMYFPDSVVGAVVCEPNSVRFTELVIRRSKRQLDARAPQSAQKNINLQDLRPLQVPRPSVAEQARIAQVYETNATRVTTETQALEKLLSLKQGLMEDLLTGRMRVTRLPNEATP